MHDSTHTGDAEPQEPTVRQGALSRARSMARRAAPVLRDVNEAIERHGGLDEVRDVVIERTGHIVKRANEAIANATAIEGVEIDRTPDVAEVDTTPAPVRRSGKIPSARSNHPLRPIRWRRVGLMIGATALGALVLKRRRH